MPKAPAEPRELMDRFVAELVNAPRKAPAATVYRAYEPECRKRNLIAISARAFYGRIRERSGPQQAEAREGAPAAYRERPWYWELQHDTPRHGRRPFEIAHIDHSELDIEVRSSSTGQLLGKPWVTFMMDASSSESAGGLSDVDPPDRFVQWWPSATSHPSLALSAFLSQSSLMEGRNTTASTLRACWRSIVAPKSKHLGAQPHFGSVIEKLSKHNKQNNSSTRCLATHKRPNAPASSTPVTHVNMLSGRCQISTPIWLNTSM